MNIKVLGDMAFRFFLIGAVVLIATFAANSSYANTFYVDCNAGSDANSGTSPGAAKIDLRGLAGTVGAAQVAAAGDTILIKRGTVCNFPIPQTIDKGVHITSSASYYKTSASDPWPVLGSYGAWTTGWVSQGRNVWKHTLAWTGSPSPPNYVRFSALGIANAGPAQLSPSNLLAPRQYYYYGGSSANDPAYVEVYAPSNPASYYGAVYYSTNAVLSFTSFGNGVAVSSGLQVDFLTFQNVDVGIALYPLDANFNGGMIQNIQCKDVHRCLFVLGNSASGDVLANFYLQASTITGASGPAVHFSGVDRLSTVYVRNLTIATTGVSESYGGIYTSYVNANVAAVDTDFQILWNAISDCRSGNLFAGDGGCIENDSGSMAVLSANNDISLSHTCYQSNSGGISGYSPPPSRALYFVNNYCDGTDILGATSDSAGQGRGLVYVTNNMLVNATVNRFSPQVPNYDALFSASNAAAVGIYVQNNFIQLSSSLPNGAYGIVNAMGNPSALAVAGNTYSANLIADYMTLAPNKPKAVQYK